MAQGSTIFALWPAQPTPEVHPDVVEKYASIVATGYGDLLSLIKNVIAFPASRAPPPRSARRRWVQNRGASRPQQLLLRAVKRRESADPTRSPERHPFRVFPRD